MVMVMVMMMMMIIIIIIIIYPVNKSRSKYPSHHDQSKALARSG